MRSRRRAAFAALAFAAFLFAGGAAGQDFLTLEFSFANPGARSMGFGGAFAAVADDATAAFANPAGLVQITRPEVSLEGRSWNLSIPFTLGGRVSGLPTGLGFDTIAGLRQSEFSETFGGVGFLSVVYPKNRWRVALYGHELADFSSANETQGLFAESGGNFEGPDGAHRNFDLRSTATLQVGVFAIAAAYRVSESVSVGLGLSHFDGSMSSVKEAFRPNDFGAGFFLPNLFLPEQVVEQTFSSIDDTDQGLNAGVLWRFAQRFKLAGFYRQGPRFELELEELSGPLAGLPLGADVFRASVPMHFPDVYGLGVAYRSADGQLTLSWEWDRVEYSDVFDSFPPEAREEIQASMPDTDEIHLGGEYVLLAAKPLLAFRLGAWLEPDHRIRSTGDSVFDQALLQPGEDQVHFAVGFGLAFQRFQVDFAADFSDLRDTASVSAVYSF